VEIVVVNPDPDFWRGRRVLLTGHTGFKGAWAALWLESLGAEVFGISRPPDTEPSLFDLLAPRHAGVLCDLAHRAAVRAAVAQARPQIVLHMAAQALVRRSYADPVETFASNVMGTVHLLDALGQQEGLEAVLVVTSDKVYGQGQGARPFVEGDALGGIDPYSASKACVEHVAASWAQGLWVGGPHLATARAGNVIGGGDWALDRIIPDVWRAWRQGVPLRLRNPQATRPWQHVLDALSGYFLYVERLVGSGRDSLPRALNFSPRAGQGLDVAAIVAGMTRALGGAASSWQHDKGPAPHEAASLSLDPGLAEHCLGWHARLPIEAALGLTADWYARHGAGEAARILCLEQIAYFESLCP